MRGFRKVRVCVLVAVYLLLAILANSPLQALELEGELQPGGLLIGTVSANEQVLLGDVELPKSSNGRFVLGLDRDHKGPLTLTVRSADGGEKTHQFDITPREFRIQRVEGIARKIMNPNADDLKRIRSESQQVKVARNEVSSREDFLLPFVWPIEGTITGVYGSQRVYNGVPGRPHYGVDVAAAVGAEVNAPADGCVLLAHNNMFYSGGTLIIDHGHGLTSSFLHLSKILVRAGQVVRGGELVALVGASGRATGPHLDWRMNWRDTRVDPQLLVPPMPDDSTAR